MVDNGHPGRAIPDWDQYIASMNDGKAAGVINGCWIMSSVQAAADQSGKWAIVNMPKLDGIRWCYQLRKLRRRKLGRFLQLQEHRAGLRLPEEHLPVPVLNCTTTCCPTPVLSSYLPAAESDVYNQPSEFYGGQTVYKDIVEFAGQVPAFDCGAYYSDVRSALTDAVTNVVQNNADIDSEMQNAQDTVEFNIAG